MEPLVVRQGLVIPIDHLSVSFTRTLEGADAAEVARTTPSTVELRFDTRGCSGFDPEDLRRILAFAPLRADRRGTVRVVCGDFRSRIKNLAGARELLRELLVEALRHPVEAAPAPRPKRGRAGLIKHE
ncbi:MAG: hypothetical protein CVU56_16505 [Deltaproteobacteria bacterium HGW-Deltaproteobacteria-14]|jgi:ribosome-associated protein|nr:MAG: hypothetical protein CVU56_16505 [Deltaproteobacteria bacterium HGW-Deltaproteobacteria-14]